MILLHTSDWHLGRIFYGAHLTDDQAHVLDQVVEIVERVKPSAVLVSGDVYDRAVPPAEAVELLNDVLSRIVLGLKVPVIVIAGNHDSPSRLEFGSKLLERQGLHVVGAVQADPSPIILEDSHGPVAVYALPFAEPAVVRGKLDDDAIHSHDGAMRALLGRLGRTGTKGARSVLMAHAFVAGSEESESERPLAVGGAGSVDGGAMAGFDYVALGHLHKPQRAGRAACRYSGSLMKYSFAEADHTKSVSIVEMDGGGGIEVEEIPLVPRRDVRCVEGVFKDLLEKPSPGEEEDFLLVRLHDKEAILDAIGRLRDIYPNVMHIERPFFRNAARGEAGPVDHRRADPADLFAGFYGQVTEDELTEAQRGVYVEVVEKIVREEREA